MNTLFEDVQKQVEEVVAGLQGEDDFMPMMIVKDHRERILCIGLVMPQEADAKDLLAASMAAICALHRATEAAFTSVAWMVAREPGKKMPDKPPSECDDRQEIVVLAAVKADGTQALFSAPMIRENSMCGVGMWEGLGEGEGSGGRFIKAMKVGISTGANMPPDMAEYVDAEVDAGREGKLVAAMTQMYAGHEETMRKKAKAREN